MGALDQSSENRALRSPQSLRVLFRYFLIGALLLVGKGLYDRSQVEGPEISVEVSADATDAEVEIAVREAILLNEARRYGWDRRDPVVFGHLVRIPLIFFLLSISLGRIMV